MSSRQVIRLQSEGGRGAVINKWKVDVGATLYEGRIVLLYEEAPEDGGKTDEGGDGETAKVAKKVVKLKSKHVGRVAKLCVKEGDVVHTGEALFEIELGCSHPVVINELCAECGADLQKEAGGAGAGGAVDGTEAGQDGAPAHRQPNSTAATIPMVHSIPQLKVSREQAQQLGRADTERLLKEKKLVLLVDLDQTLIHTTHDNIPNNLKDVHHFQLLGCAQNAWYHTRLRPGTARFLSEMYRFYELHICTFGVRPYAHTVAHILDKDARLFSNRILSRDECFDYNSKVANLQALFPCGDELVCIIDDRVDVWNFSKNLIPVKPYQFFRTTTGDPNLPNPLQFDMKTDTTSFFARGVKLKKRDTNKSKTDQGKGAEEERSEEEGKEDKIEDAPKDGEVAKDTEVVKDIQVKDTEDNEVTNDEDKAMDKDGKEEETLTEEDKKDVSSTKDEIIFEEEEDEGDVIDVEDEDDYLLYLEVILKKVHSMFYKVYNKEVEGVADVKWIIQELKSQVLKGCTIVFSGLVPINNNSGGSNSGTEGVISTAAARAEGWSRLARSLGAQVGQDLEAGVTTHLVAANPSTLKVHKARKMKGVNIVVPKWLINCAHRWERVDEQLFSVRLPGEAPPEDEEVGDDETTANMMLLLGPEPLSQSASGSSPPPVVSVEPLVLSQEAVEAIKDQFDEEFTSGSSMSSESEEQEEEHDDDDDDSENPRSDLGGDTDEEEEAEERLNRRKRMRRRKRKRKNEDGDEDREGVEDEEEWSQLAHQIEQGLDDQVEGQDMEGEDSRMECDDYRSFLRFQGRTLGVFSSSSTEENFTFEER